MLPSTHGLDEAISACVRIKRPDLCCAPGSTCPRAEECRTAGLGKQRRRTTQRLSILVECPEVRNSNRSTAARPISSDWYVPLGWFPFLSRCPRASRSFLLVPMGSASMHLLHRLLRRPRGIGLSAPPAPAVPLYPWDLPPHSSIGRFTCCFSSSRSVVHVESAGRFLYGIDRLPLI